jgi:hypothetical protein
MASGRANPTYKRPVFSMVPRPLNTLLKCLPDELRVEFDHAEESVGGVVEGAALFPAFDGAAVEINVVGWVSAGSKLTTCSAG